MTEVPTLIVLLLAATAAVVVANWVRVSYTLVLLVVGLAIGSFEHLDVAPISGEVILLVFLPPLVFEAAFQLDIQTLRRVRNGVALLALPGVLLATLVGGAVTYFGLGLPWTTALLFGALIAATDPVSVLATFRDLGVGRRLRVLVEGESLVNDGTALALVATLSAAAVSGISTVEAVSDLTLSIVGGVVVGVVVGVAGQALIARLEEHLTEIAVSVAVAYGAFLLADELGVSGVLSTIAAAMTMRWLGRSRGTVLTRRGQEIIRDVWEFLAFVANAGLFLLIGLEVRFADLGDHLDAVIWGVVAALVGRAVVAYVSAIPLRWVGVPVTPAERHVLFWGGLRGAVALAGALSLPEDIPGREELLAMTYGAVLFTLLAQGLTIGPLVRALGLSVPARIPAEPDAVPGE